MRNKINISLYYPKSFVEHNLNIDIMSGIFLLREISLEERTSLIYYPLFVVVKEVDGKESLYQSNKENNII